MYNPPPFRMSEVAAMFDAIDHWNFGLVISAVDSNITTSFLPFVLDRTNNRLLGHFARANRHWEKALKAEKVLVSFQGPHCYVSPSWYSHANLVPTWNYLSIQVSGKLTLITAPEECHALMNHLVEQHERNLSSPWKTTNMDESALNTMMQAIVCFEVSIDDIEGKAKLSQNRSLADRHGVIAQLRQSDTDDERRVAKLMTNVLPAQPTDQE